MSERMPIIPPTDGRQTDFTMHQLALFRTVAQHLSYTRAAEVLYLSQPAISQQIRTLELTLGLRLFARSGRGIILTPAGQEFLRHAERLLTLLTETAPVVHEIQTLERGSVLVGASASAGTYVVPPLLGAFHTRYPKIRITLIVANRRSIEERLLAQEVDVVVMSLIERQEKFYNKPLMPYELVVVAAPTHKLAHSSTATLHDLQGEMFLLREQGSGTRLETEQHFVQTGVPLRASLELGSIEAIKEGVIAGLGVAVLPRESVALEVTNGDLIVLDVQGFPLQRQWYIIHLRGRKLSLAAATFRQFLLESIAGTPLAL